MSTREAIQYDSFGRFWFLHLLVENLHNDLITDQTSRLDNPSDSVDEVLVESTADGALEDFSDLVASGDMVVVEILSEELGIGAFADSWSTEQKDELLFASRKVLEDLGCQSMHDITIK